MKTGANIEAARHVGKQIAERAIKAGRQQVVFDRGGYMYHGRVKALAERPARAASTSKTKQRGERRRQRAPRSSDGMELHGA